MKDGGFLFLGKSETAGEYVNLFKPVASAEKIYTKAEGKVEDLAPPTFNIPNIQNISLKNIHAGMMVDDTSSSDSRYMRFLEEHLPASVSSTRTTPRCTSSAITATSSPWRGKASLNFFHMLCKDLSLAAATPSRAAATSTPPSPTRTSRGLPLRPKVINLTVEPVQRAGEENELVAVFFREGTMPAGGVVEKYDLDATAARRMRAERGVPGVQSDLRPPSSGWRR